MNRKLLPEERKGQILRTALKLFKEKGYEHTSVRDIIGEAGVSKGCFYYYYDSKEDLLEELAHLFMEEALEIVERIAGRDDLSALEKTNEYIRRVNSYKKEKGAGVSALLFEIYSGGKNVRLESKIFDYARKQLSPIMKSIVAQGIEEGDFRTDFPQEAAEFYVKLFMLYQREIGEAFTRALREGNREKIEALKRKYAFLQEVVESTFGLERGSLVLEEVAWDTIENLWREYTPGS